MICHIFGAAACGFEKVDFDEDDLVIAADGGLARMQALGMKPHVIIGDFDSLGYVPEGTEVRRLPVEKDITDMAAAVEVGKARGYKVFNLYGATGGRPDHTMANYQLLARLAEEDCVGYLMDADFKATAISVGSALIFHRWFEGTFSVFAVGGEAQDVHICGSHYTLAGETLSPTVPLGVSNSFCGKNVTITVGTGTLLVMWEGKYLPLMKKLSQ